MEAPVIFLLLSFITGVVCQNEAPRFTHDLDGFSLDESTPIGSLVFQLKGIDPEGDPLEYGLNTDMFEVRDPATGEVYVARSLDYEREKKPSITMWISDGVNKVERQATINILDSNDEMPTFDLTRYKITIPENIPVGDVVYKTITVTDADLIGEVIQVNCEPVPESPGACKVFGLNVLAQSNREWTGNIVLREPLDYEGENVYQLELRAFDGVNTRSQSVEIDLIDVQDTAPRFSGANTAIIDENLPLSKSVLRVVARDGDEDSDRPIRYSFVSNPGRLFSIDQVSGDVTTAAEIDRESDLIKDGYVKLRVKACEMLNVSHAADDALSCAETELTITVNDVNDNGPVITPARSMVNVTELLQNDQSVPGVVLAVTDLDLGPRSQFELSLGNYQNVFKILPNVGAGFVEASIVVLDASLIDYDLREQKFDIRVIARETDTAIPREHDAYVTVVLMDENDNYPVFQQSYYAASVKEMSGSRTPVIQITATDLDSGNYGIFGVRYRLQGSGAEKFKVDARTGEVTVRGCFTPGRGRCLDAEQRAQYNMTFVATDNTGEGNQARVPLIVNVLDENDNTPKFGLNNYLTYILEGEDVTDPELSVQATDADSPLDDNNKITYTIIGGNADNLWRIDPITGKVTATSEADYETTPGGLGYYNLTVKASDPDHSVTAQVRIIVIDTNDHAPVFTPDYYELSIPENTQPGVLVETVVAFDADPASGPNGQIQYRITGGSQDLFTIDPNTGEISVAPGATFDYDVKKRYVMSVIGLDQGQPQKQDNATVVVNILDANNKDPYFRPATIRADVMESEPVGFEVVQISAIDPDSAAVLVYYLEEPTYAWDPDNNPVDLATVDFTTGARKKRAARANLFSIERDTGKVTVNQPLDYDKVALVSLTVRAVDNSAVGQSANATLVIIIRKVNDRPPIFGPPWTPDRPYFSVNVREAQGEDSYITTLVASDPSDVIDEYRLLTNPGGHFKINPKTGVVTVAVPLDYETDKVHEVIAVAIDNGIPQLTATATVTVNVENVNDENPIFVKNLYEVEIYENSPEDTEVVQVEATDLDLEDFGVLRYELDDPRGFFVIDELTGEITVGPNADLDRETDPVLTVTAKVYDSPNNPDVRRYASVPVYIRLLDVNDNAPTLSQREFSKNILENVPIDTSVIQLTFKDDDDGDNADGTYTIVDGNEQNFFKIDPDTGLVTTDASLLGYPGAYNLTIEITDGGTTPMKGTGFLLITVQPANNGAPVWVIPNENNFTVTALENQYLGMEVITVYSTDEDVVTYGFEHEGEFRSETPEFEINPFTGVITAKKVFDREEQSTYTILLVARDSGSPPFETPRYLTVQILDVDDHDPEFPQFRNCCTIPYEMKVYEDTATDTFLGEVIALDKDIGANAHIRYYIINGNDDGTFMLNAETGKLYLSKPLDHEVTSVYELTIEAQDGEKTPSELGPNCRCQNPSLVKLFIIVLDQNDFPVEFPVDVFTACVPVDAQIGRHVTTIQAVDPDTGATTGFDFSIYNLINRNTRTPNNNAPARQDSFIIGATNGSVHTNTLMTQFEYNYFSMGVRVSDAGGMPADTELKVWVTQSSQEVTLTFRSPIKQVQADLDNILEMISRMTNSGVVCVEDLRYYVDDAGVVNTDWTDLVIYIVDGDGLYVLDAATAVGIIEGDDGLTGAYGMAAIKETYGAWGGFITWPILAAIIAIILLILLALLLLCLLCYCCKAGAIYAEEYQSYKEPIIYADTINPLWKLKLNDYEDQELTMSMQDYAQAGMVNKGFEAMEGLSNGTAAFAHESHVETTHSQFSMSRSEDMVDAAADVNDVRIEADLVASTNDLSGTPRIEAALIPPAGTAAAMATTTTNSSRQFAQSSVHVERTQMGAYEAQIGAPRPSMISEATMTDQQAVYVAPSPAPPHPTSPFPHPQPPQQPAGPARIGATLTTQRRTQQQVVGNAYSDIGDYRSAPNLSLYGTSPRANLNQQQQPPLRHESVQSSSYQGEPIFTPLSPSSNGNVFNTTQEEMHFGPSSPGPSSPGGGGDMGVYQGEIHLGSLAANGGGRGRRYRETHERREYEEGYIEPDDRMYIYS